MTTESATTFAQLALSDEIQSALRKVGYESPSPIQAQTIPHLLTGRDVVGQAQTGTGKTAAFALPLLSRLEPKAGDPQILVLTPTRELSIQVAEAFQKYAAHIPGFQVLPVYGGQDYGGQIRSLRRGVHVVVGTPGRITDHMRRGTLRLGHLSALVLDEADEMLRMGFVEEVEWILEQTPEQRQIALFSATMPAQIRRIAQRHLNNPAEVTIEVRTTTAETIRQRYWPVSGMHKLDALTRILEAEPFDALLVFVRTKIATVELADKLAARGFAVAPLNGDVPQAQRERTVEHLKSGRLDILVATDVAARGLDVGRVTHVINYDIPLDTESYVHRIGRTGRAGKKGDAILFVAPRERRMLAAIEQSTRQRIETMTLPTTEQINDKRIARFKQSITDSLAVNSDPLFQDLIEQYQQEHNVPALEIAAALAHLLHRESPLLYEHKSKDKFSSELSSRPGRSAEKPDRKGNRKSRSGSDMEIYRLEVGHAHQVSPGNIVGAIANEAGLDSAHIGRVRIQEEYSTVELPRGMPKDVFQTLRRARIAGRPLNLSRMTAGKAASDVGHEEHKSGAPKRKGKPKHAGKTKKFPLRDGTRTKPKKGKLKKRKPD